MCTNRTNCIDLSPSIRRYGASGNLPILYSEKNAVFQPFGPVQQYPLCSRALNISTVGPSTTVSTVLHSPRSEQVQTIFAPRWWLLDPVPSSPLSAPPFPGGLLASSGPASGGGRRGLLLGYPASGEGGQSVATGPVKVF